METAELILALVGLPVLTALVTHWFDRRKTNGEASLAYAQASGLIAEQNEKMSARLDSLQTKLTSLECEHKILQSSYDLLVIELQKRDAKIETLQLEIRNLRLALGKQLEK